MNKKLFADGFLPEQNKLTIVLPTYNESSNILPVLHSIREALDNLSLPYQILFVDDSTDDTPEVIQLQKKHFPIELIHRKPEDRTGLSTALVLGMQSAKTKYICCMDSDLQHPPTAIPGLIKKMIIENADIAVASRYLPGGSADGLGGMYRKAVSHLCRYSAYFVIPSVRKTTDPGSGFYIIKKRLINEMSLDSGIYGFKILIDMLARSKTIKVVEHAYKFLPRLNDESKATVRQGILFYWQLFMLFVFYQSRRLLKSLQTIIILIGILATFYFSLRLTTSFMEGAVIFISLALFFQGLFMIFLMTYAWENPDRIKHDQAPKTFFDPILSFSLFIPVRQEERVIADTIRSVARIDYPQDKYETFILVNDDDDADTIAIVQKTIAEVGKENIKLITFSGPLGKTLGLNIGLKNAKNDIVTIFDAEDEIHKNILNVANTTMISTDSDVVQSGVQLMNYQSSWYALFNVMEYFFWFKSALHFFAHNYMVPLGGNTVFFKRDWLNRINGWDHLHLTEDADIGIRLSLAGARVSVVYDAEYATREETPSTIKSFIKQRTRWNQGFIQILMQGTWLQFPHFHQRILAFYVFSWVIVQGLIFIFIPVSAIAALYMTLPPILGIVTNLPLYTLFIIFIVVNIGIYEFTKSYSLKYSPLIILKTIVFFIPFQLLLGVSAFRAIWRHFVMKDRSWEKTSHFNIGRGDSELKENVS